MSLKISYKTIKLFICALAGILSMNPYFVWPTYANGKFTVIVYGVYLLSIIIMFKKNPKIKGRNILSMFLLVSIYCITNLNVYGTIKFTTAFGAILVFTYLIAFCNLSREYQKDIFNLFIKLFVISLIPGLVYYILETIGVSLAIGMLKSQNQLNYAQSVENLIVNSVGGYKHYIGAVMRISSNTRFSGIYDEAGLVGTVAALCLIAKGFNLKKDNWSKLLLLFAIISFSLAGYILLIGFFLLESLKKQKWKVAIEILILLIAAYILLTGNFDSKLIKTLQNRVIIENGKISIIDNRVTSNFEKGFSELRNGSVKNKLFGFGRGAATANKYINGSSSYKCSIYNYGYLGFGIMIFTIVFIYKPYIKKILSNNWYEFCLLIIFLVSIYQRPSVYLPYYFIILYGGAAFISNQNANLNQKRKEEMTCK